VKSPTGDPSFVLTLASAPSGYGKRSRCHSRETGEGRAVAPLPARGSGRPGENSGAGLARLCAGGTPAEIKQSPRSDIVRSR
jgi:hypothetical protein